MELIHHVPVEIPKRHSYTEFSNVSRLSTKKIRDFCKNEFQEIKEPIDLLLRSNSTKDTIFICKQILLILNQN